MPLLYQLGQRKNRTRVRFSTKYFRTYRRLRGQTLVGPLRCSYEEGTWPYETSIPPPRLSVRTVKQTFSSRRSSSPVKPLGVVSSQIPIDEVQGCEIRSKNESFNIAIFRLIVNHHSQVRGRHGVSVKRSHQYHQAQTLWCISRSFGIKSDKKRLQLFCVDEICFA